MMSWKKFTAGLTATAMCLSAYLYMNPVVAQQGTVQIGGLINSLANLTLPLVSTDKVLVSRGGVGFQSPSTTFLGSGNNLSDVGNKATSRTNIGLGPSVSIMDYGADPLAGNSSDAAFVSCTTSGKNCYIPPGTYLITCAVHNASASTTIYGDNWQAATLRIAAPAANCLPAGGLIALANAQNLTIDVNFATASVTAPILTSISGSSAIQIPTYKDVHLVNVGASGGVNNANIIGFKTGAVAAGNVIPNLIHNTFSIPPGATPSTTLNQCILITQSVGTVNGGIVDSNFCGGSGMDISAGNLKITNNEIGSYAYRAGIYTEQATASNTYSIIGNQIHNGGTAVVGGVPTDGIVNWGRNSVISNNQCTSIGGVCVANGGHHSTISDNNANATAKRVDQTGGAAYFSNFQDVTYNGNNSIWSGNYGADDTSGKMIEGFADNAGNAGLSLINNYFPGIATPYFLSD